MADCESVSRTDYFLWKKNVEDSRIQGVITDVYDDMNSPNWSVHTRTNSSQEIKNDNNKNIETTNACLETEIIERTSSVHNHPSHNCELNAAVEGKKFCWRYVIVALMQTSIAIFASLQESMSVALLCMTEQPGSSLESNDGKQDITFNSSNNMSQVRKIQDKGSEMLHDNSTEMKVDGLEFSWDSPIQGLILTSILFLAPVGPFLPNFIRSFVDIGNKHILSIFILAVLVTFICPLGARVNPYVLVTLRVVLGLLLGTNIPIIGDMISYWAPIEEKLFIVSSSFVGFSIGSMLASLLSGFLCSIPVDNGWPFTFYVSGAIALVWGAAWHFLSTEKPEDHPFISVSEKEYILSHRAEFEDENWQVKRGHPYKEILTSASVLALVVTGCCYEWCVAVVLLNAPSYLSTIHGFSVEETGGLFSVVSLFRMFGTFMWTAIGNIMAAKMSINVTRKACIGVGFLLSSLSVLSIAFRGDGEHWLAYSLLLFAMLCQASGTSNLFVIPQDIAPKFSGFVTGLLFSVSNLVAASGPIVISFIKTSGTQLEWTIIWIVVATVYLLGAVCFCLLGDASLQDWAMINKNYVEPAPAAPANMSTFIDRLPSVSVVQNTNFRDDGIGMPQAFGGTTPSAMVVSKERGGQENRLYESHR